MWKNCPAPKDGTLFLADINMPWPLPCVYSPACEKFIVATPQCGLYEGEWNDWYFENEDYREKEIRRWMPMPELP